MLPSPALISPGDASNPEPDPKRAAGWAICFARQMTVEPAANVIAVNVAIRMRVLLSYSQLFEDACSSLGIPSAASDKEKGECVLLVDGRVDLSVGLVLVNRILPTLESNSSCL